ncbi:MAG: RNA polymerase factor sigma-32 [Myxococcaceae bacterium]|nr:RNA polymerase factor sigma-32 [Myxococcaceae bacterium]
MANGRKRTKSPASRPRAKRPAAPAPEAEEAEAEQEAEAAVEPEALEPEPEALAEIEDAEGPVAPTTALAPAGEAGLIRRDPLQAYMAEVTRHPLLSREEEYALAKQYQQTGDVQAAYRLVASNLRLVVKLAHEYHRNPLSLLDLVQEGNIGLMQAVKKYDPERGVKLSSYAAWWIRAYILRYIMDNWKMVKLGTTEAQRKLFFKLRQEQDRLIAQGFEPSPKLLAERLNVTEQDVVEMDQRLGHDELSIDAPLGDDTKSTRAERYLPSMAAGAEERLGNEQLKELFRENLAEFAKTLEGKERFIFENRLIADEPLTLQDIGDKYGVSRERARQIEAALINRMREFMRERIPDFDLVAVPKG